MGRHTPSVIGDQIRREAVAAELRELLEDFSTIHATGDGLQQATDCVRSRLVELGE